MLKLNACILLLFVLNSVLGATFQGNIDENPDYPGHCYFNHDRNSQVTYFKAGKIGYDPQSCMKYTCSSSVPGKMFIQGYSCGKVMASPPCRVIETRVGVYPDCCPTVECPSSDVHPTANELYNGAKI